MCAYPKVLQEVAAHHGTVRPPENWEHNSKRSLIRIVPPIPELWNCSIHAECQCNELVSAANRVLGVVPLPTAWGIATLRKEMRRLIVKIPSVQPLSFSETLETFPSERRPRYQQAWESLVLNPLVPADARISAFVKAEKFDPNAKENPDPRMIQARDPRYNLVLARYLRPIEKIIYGLKDSSETRMVAKGLNQGERASLLKEKFQMFEDPVCFSIDASRWDKHVSKPILEIEHSFYLGLHGGHPELDRLLKWQINNKVRTQGGMKYECVGGRMSGDMNTALGNCLLMVLMVRAALRHLKIRAGIMDDGDDCLVICDQKDFEKLKQQLIAIFLEFGQELKIENVTHDIRKVIFCQSQMVFDGEKDLMVRDWRKVLSHACCGTKHWNDPNEVRPMMGLVGACELALSAGVPILQEFALALIRMSDGKTSTIKNVMSTGLYYRIKYECGSLEIPHSKSRPVSDKAREAFTKAFGITASHQRDIEGVLRHWNLDSVVADEFHTEWDSRWEDLTHPDNMRPVLL